MTEEQLQSYPCFLPVWQYFIDSLIDAYCDEEEAHDMFMVTY